MPILSSKKSPGKTSGLGTLLLKKSREKKKLLLPAVLVLILILAGIFYGSLKFYKASLKKRNQELQERIQENKKRKAELQKEEVFNFQGKIDILEELLKKHLYWTTFFRFLEESTMPKVYFTNFSADVSDNQVNLEGITPSLSALAQQIVVFKTQELVEEVKLLNLNFVEEGIKFSISLKISPQAWQKKDES